MKCKKIVKKYKLCRAEGDIFKSPKDLQFLFDKEKQQFLPNGTSECVAFFS